MPYPPSPESSADNRKVSVREIRTLNQYQTAARPFASYPGMGEPLGLVYSSLALCGEAGEAADKVKKMMRDDGFVLSEERRLALIDEAGDCLWYLASVAFELGVTLEQVATRNIQKLSDRRMRNVLHGDGDER